MRQIVSPEVLVSVHWVQRDVTGGHPHFRVWR